MNGKEMFYYPGWHRKAITFTIDDGNLELDRKFLDIVKPAGIKGSFNLVGLDRMGNLTAEEYREFYRGYEVTNHCKHHPKVILPTDECKVSDELFDPMTSDTDFIYKTDREGLYHKFYRKWWGKVATTDTYIQLIDEGKEEIESVFGEGSVTAFVWPFSSQPDERLHAYLKKAGYTSVRRTGTATFDLPEDRMDWCYNAIHSNLNERAAEFEALPDDGSLKFFCFGVHSHDFENNNCWDVLEKFAAEYGNRVNDFWYATVRDIFEYEDAINAAEVTESEIINRSDKAIYIKIGREEIEIPPHGIYNR